MSKAPLSSNWARDYRLRFPQHQLRINAYQAIAHWRDYKKALPPDDIIAELEIALRADPPDANGLQLTIDIWTRKVAQLEAWRAEHELLEDETLQWLNAPLNAEGPTR